MTDIFTGLWGRKKRQNSDTKATTDDSFVSYIEKELSDDLNDFVLIETHPAISSYQTRFEYSSQRSTYFEKFSTKSPMGNGSSASNGKQQEINAEIQVTEPNELMYTREENETQNNDEDYNVSTFLSGVPFELCSKLNTFQSMQTVKIDGFQYLSSKADMLENLSYDFRLERAVLFETECAVSDFQLICTAE